MPFSLTTVVLHFQTFTFNPHSRVSPLTQGLGKSRLLACHLCLGVHYLNSTQYCQHLFSHFEHYLSVLSL